MQLLKDRILKDGIVKPGNILKVDSFLNPQMDIDLINELEKNSKDVLQTVRSPKFLQSRHPVSESHVSWHSIFMYL